MQRPVMVALSGGVDSSVSLLLALRHHRNKSGWVQAVFMANWDPHLSQSHSSPVTYPLSPSTCSIDRDFERAQRICETLQVPLTRVDFSRHYWTDVFDPTLQAYTQGTTPNPDIQCNRVIKFGCLKQWLKKEKGDDWILATGHYARIQYSQSDKRWQLLMGNDQSKDQSYFLSHMPYDALKETWFPVGEMQKSMVKQMAIQHGLPSALQRESMGLCFVGKHRHFHSFLSEFIPPSPGPILTLSGEYIGEHVGLFEYTIGQRIRVSHKSQKWFVLRKNAEKNEIVVVADSNDPGLYSTRVNVKHWYWLSRNPVKENTLFWVRTRYQGELVKARVSEEGVDLIQSVRAITPGQVVVVWDNAGECLGCGEIA